jgi:hypothetical protein
MIVCATTVIIIVEYQGLLQTRPRIYMYTIHVFSGEVDDDGNWTVSRLVAMTVLFRKKFQKSPWTRIRRVLCIRQHSSLVRFRDPCIGWNHLIRRPDRNHRRYRSRRIFYRQFFRPEISSRRPYHNTANDLRTLIRTPVRSGLLRSIFGKVKKKKKTTTDVE